MDYHPNLADHCYILFDVLQADKKLQQLEGFAHIDADLMRQVMEESGKFVRDVVAPLQRVGDTIGAQYQDGAVTMPPGFTAAYQQFWRNGWAGLSTDEADGGQAMPEVLNQILYENLSAANHGWTMAPGLLHGAYQCIKHHASDALKTQYLNKVGTGEWLATMCLTESHAGSDLGLVRTKAEPLADGSYAISGTKIFISGGEHDLTNNIVHLVLARLPDAPPGPKGLSLFLAPKFLPDDRKNSVHCDRIEEKMGLHGSPTCVMRFDAATGWLVGESGRGLGAMFVMMNSARLHVALQGVGLLDTAWKKASAYAAERRQMRAPVRRDSTAQADCIEEHPAIQRVLLTQRAWIDGARVLAYHTSIEIDVAKHHANKERRDQANRWCALITPVMKAAFTRQAFHGGSDLLQVFGGHGYVSEWGIEQIVRDARVSMIYEGTNEIQAIDLLVRKVIGDGGAAMAVLLSDLSTHSSSLTSLRLDVIAQLTRQIVDCNATDLELAYWLADDYLAACAVALLGWAWDQINAATSSPASASSASIQHLRASHKAYLRWVAPEFDKHTSIIQAALHG